LGTNVSVFAITFHTTNPSSFDSFRLQNKKSGLNMGSLWCFKVQYELNQRC